jgi:hypothetical protein
VQRADYVVTLTFDDGEGWGPLSSATLERLLERLVERDDTRVLPVGAALALGAR